MPRPEKGWVGNKVRQWFFELQMTNYWNLNGELESRQIFTAPGNFRTERGELIEFILLPNREVLPVNFEVSDGVVIPIGDYKFVNYRFEVNTASYRKVQFDFSYRFGQFYNGKYNDLEPGLTLKLNGYATVQVGGNLVRGYLPVGNFSENVYFSKLNLYLTPDHGISNYVQFDDISNHIGYNGRFFWQIKPGNTVYLVYNNIIERFFDPERRFKMIEDQTLFKIQTTFRY